MDRQTVIELNRRMLDHMTRRSTDCAAAELRIPGRVFCDPGQLARERRALFASTPQPAAFAGELPGPGSFLALRLLDTPVLLTRDDSGRLRAFVNACAHRGAAIASGSGVARRLTCPFHGWAYNLDGSLRGRPGEEHFNSPADVCALTTLPVCERHGVVVIGPDQAMSDAVVADALSELGPELQSYGLSDYRPLQRREFDVAANWKLVNDLSLESYHFATLHRDSVAAMLAANAAVDTFGRHSRWAFPLKSIARLAQLDQQAWPTELQGSVTYTLYPGVMLLVNALGAQMIRAEPGADPASSRVSYIGMHAPDADPAAARQAYEFGGDVFADEDLPAAEACQRGIAARGGDFILGANEPLLQFWHGQWHRASGE